MTKNKTLRNYDADYLISELSSEKRAEIARSLAEKLEAGLSEFERELTWAVARQLAEDAVEMVRLSLARSVCNCKFLPKDIGHSLAYDIDSVACPFLRATEIFSEEELREIAGAVSDSVRVAIADRDRLTARVTGLLAEIGNIDVAQKLLKNKRADIDEAGFALLSERFGVDDTLLETMAMRTDLPSAIAADLIKRVSRSAREQLEKNYEMAPDFVNVLAQDAQNNALLELAEFKSAAHAMNYAKTLNDKDELSHTFCLVALRNGNLRFFEAAISVLSGTSLQNVELILRDGGLEAIRRLCTKAGFPSLLHREIAEALSNRVG